MADRTADVLIIGAGPAGAIAASMLHDAGFDVLVVEKQEFPRFVIGESLLPRSMELLEEAGLLEDVQKQGFMRKDGAEVKRGSDDCCIQFANNFTEGWDYTYQVTRADFDKTLADTIQAKGVPILWRYGVVDVRFEEDATRSYVRLESPDGQAQEVTARFILDGSGYGRVLPKLLGLDEQSHLPPREAYFTHVTGDVRPKGDAEGRIWICLLDDVDNAWVWIIPFSNGLTSVGVVAKPDFLARYPEDPDQKLRAILDENPNTHGRLKDAGFSFPVRRIQGYSVSVKQLYGPGYALMGNATEFLDPVFSSGVTLAMESGSQAAKILIRELNGEQPDWQKEYADYLMGGVDVFRTFVKAWYDGRLPTIFFNSNPQDNFRRQICSVLAGYVWDQENPCVSQHERVIDVIARACSEF